MIIVMGGHQGGIGGAIDLHMVEERRDLTRGILSLLQTVRTY